MSDDKIETPSTSFQIPIGVASTSSKRRVRKPHRRTVYLRINPASAKDNTLQYSLRRPKTSLHEIRIQYQRFKFTKIFDQDSSQTEVFDNSVRSAVVDFINGRTSTILMHGLSDLGTTLYGTIEDPGIIPRAIELVFATVRCTSQPWYKPMDSDQIIVLNEEDRVAEEEFKNKILDELNSHGNVRSLLANRNFQDSESNDEGRISSIWISICSLLNDECYDEIDIGSAPIKLSSRADCFAMRMKFVHIATPIEAFELLFGILSMGRLNVAQKDRSFIFRMELLQYQEENAADTVSVNRLVIASLALSNEVERNSSEWSTSETESFEEEPPLYPESITFIANIDVDSECLEPTMSTLKCSRLIGKFR